jgi:transposase
VVTHRTASSRASTAQSPVCGPQTDTRPSRADWHRVRAALGHCVEPAAAGNGLRLRHRLLATARRMAEGRCLATYPRNAAGRTAPPWRNRLNACHRRQLINSRHAGGKKTGPNPTDRRKLGSKHHLIVDAQGIPLAVILTGANRHDITQLDALVQAIPHIRGKRGTSPAQAANRSGRPGLQFRATSAALARTWHHARARKNWLAPWQRTRQNALASRALDCLASLVSTPEASL